MTNSFDAVKWRDPTAYREPANHRDDPHHFTLTFGKFAGFMLGEVSDGYLEWLSRSANEEQLRELAELVLLDRAGCDDGDAFQVAPPSEAFAREVLPLLAFNVEQGLRTEFGEPDPGTVEALAVERCVRVVRAITVAHTGRRYPTDAELAEAAKAVE